MTWAGRLWVAGVMVAAAAGVAIALWRAPRTVDVPEDSDRPASSGPHPAQQPPRPAPAMPAPPDVAAVLPALLALQAAGRKPSIER